MCYVSVYGNLFNNGQQLGVRSLPVSISVTAVSGKTTFGRSLKNNTKHTEYHLNLNRHRLIKQFLYSENSTLVDRRQIISAFSHRCLKPFTGQRDLTTPPQGQSFVTYYLPRPPIYLPTSKCRA